MHVYFFFHYVLLILYMLIGFIKLKNFGLFKFIFDFLLFIERLVFYTLPQPNRSCPSSVCPFVCKQLFTLLTFSLEQLNQIY